MYVCKCNVLFLFTFGEARSDFARRRRSVLEVRDKNVSAHFVDL